VCACLDMIFALLMMSVYLLRLTIERVGPLIGLEDVELPRGFLKPNERPGITATFWVAAFVINITQFIIGYLLFAAAKKSMKNEADATLPIARCKLWLIVANAVFVMLISKFIFFVFFDKGSPMSVVKVLVLVLCTSELVFKAYAMYFVKEFFDALKLSANPYPFKQQPTITIISAIGTRQTDSPRNHSLA